MGSLPSQGQKDMAMGGLMALVSCARNKVRASRQSPQMGTVLFVLVVWCSMLPRVGFLVAPLLAPASVPLMLWVVIWQLEVRASFLQ